MALAQILLRRGTSAEWATANPVLAAGEFGYDSTAKRAKVGDGQNAWTGLSWVTMSSSDVTRLEAAAAALQGATAPTDAAMTTIQANPNSAFAQAQKATIAASSQPRLKPTSPDRSAYGGFLYQTSPTAIIGVGAANRIYLVQGVGAGTLRRSENLGVGTIATSVPANCQASSCQQIYEWNGYVYGIFQDTTDSAFKVYRAPITTGGTALTWSAALLTLTPGATSFGCTITGTSNALIIGEYGDPVISGTKTAKIWRTTDGTTFAATRTFGSAIRHVHAVAADPYNNGHVYASFGDGVADCYVFSNDHGATWQVITCSAGFQGVQISFSADWIYIAPDATAPRSSLFVMDRATRTIRLGSTDSHRNLHVESPGSYTHGVTTSGSTTLTTGAPDYSPVFVAADKGRRIYGNGIPDGTTISAVNSSGNITLSQAATATATGVTFTIERAERPRQYAFLGAVDPATGIYYGVTNNDPSTMPPGMALGRLMLFMIPYVGGPVIRLEELGIYGTAIFLDAQRLFYGQVYRELTRLT